MGRHRCPTRHWVTPVTPPLSSYGVLGYRGHEEEDRSTDRNTGPEGPLSTEKTLSVLKT